MTRINAGIPVECLTDEYYVGQRIGFQNGYEQAGKEFMEKAKLAFKEKFGCLTDGAMWIAFEQFMNKD